MFVRFTTRKKSRSRGNLGDLLVARLVESRRPAPGLAPRQKQIAYLGAIRTAMPMNHRIVFWENVVWRLDRLHLSADDRAAVEKAIEDKVPRDTRDTWERWPF